MPNPPLHHPRVFAWYFPRESASGEPIQRDGSPIEHGTWLPPVQGAIEVGDNGYHASLRALDAIRYARSSWVSRVILSTDIEIGFDLACARQRFHIWTIDASHALRSFAKWCALETIKHTPGYCLSKVARKFLEQDVDDHDLLTEVRNSVAFDESYITSNHPTASWAIHWATASSPKTAVLGASGHLSSVAKNNTAQERELITRLFKERGRQVAEGQQSAAL